MDSWKQDSPSDDNINC